MRKTLVARHLVVFGKSHGTLPMHPAGQKGLPTIHVYPGWWNTTVQVVSSTYLALPFLRNVLLKPCDALTIRWALSSFRSNIRKARYSKERLRINERIFSGSDQLPSSRW